MCACELLPLNVFEVFKNEPMVTQGFDLLYVGAILPLLEDLSLVDVVVGCLDALDEFLILQSLTLLRA